MKRVCYESSANWILHVKFCGTQAQKIVDFYQIHCAIGIEVSIFNSVKYAKCMLIRA